VKAPALLTLQHHDPPSVAVAPSHHPRAPSPHPCRPGQPRPVAPIPLGGGRLRDRPFSSTTAAVTDWGGAPDSSTTMATANPSSTCTGSGSAHGGWGRASEGTTRALWAKHFRGTRLSTPVSACLREDRIKVSNQDKLKSSQWKLRR
jgi:hypothetical protein